MNIKAKQIERHFKAAANHWRIEILFIIKKQPDISLVDIAEKLKANIKTVSEHVKKLSAGGLVNKRYKGQTLMHTLSPYGKRFFDFINTF